MYIQLIAIRLWGNPKHMSYAASALRTKHGPDSLHILIAKTNRDNLTYDGIDLGGERVTDEIEKYIKYIEGQGARITKLSIVGYSLGGLIARYVIGLLHSKGYFDRIQPLNFTTFAAPHIGTRTPISGFGSRVWNLLGSSTLSVSGQQLFITDSFRDSGKPLLSLLASPDAVFTRALKSFRHRVLYANIVNDRSTPYYTSSISHSDPFKGLNDLTINYLPAYDPVVLDDINPLSIAPPRDRQSLFSRWLTSSQTFFSALPFYTFLGVFMVIGVPVFLINALVQSFRSSRRIRLHQAGRSGIAFGTYNLPALTDNAHSISEDLLQPLSPSSEGHIVLGQEQNGKATKQCEDNSTKSLDQITGFSELTLSPEQLDMIARLDEVGFTKHRVHIHEVRHSHAAIVVRTGRKAFYEGKLVIRHWLDEEFQI